MREKTRKMNRKVKEYEIFIINLFLEEGQIESHKTDYRQNRINISYLTMFHSSL